MAKCDEGYRCDVCGKDVEDLVESSLYLAYVIGDIDPELLHTSQERHLTCNPVLAQFITDESFSSVFADGDFDKRKLDPKYVEARESVVTRGFQRLKQLRGKEGLSILEYPLPEVRDRLASDADDYVAQERTGSDGED